MSERFTPWFGSWPPEIRGEGKEPKMSNKPNRLCRLFTKTNVVLLVALVVGVGLLLTAHYVTIIGTWQRDVLGGLGIAFITASILGFAVDKVLKRELASEAVKAAIGYILPDELKEEMRWVVGLQFLAIEHTSIYKIECNEDGKTVRMHVEQTRRIKNFTESSQDINVSLSIDEWGIKDKPSKIEEVCYHLESGSWKYIDVSNPKLVDGALHIKSQKVKIPAGEWIEVKIKYQETKQTNDVAFMVFLCSTVKPNVIVHPGKGIKYRKGFTHRDGEPEDDILQGSLLPYQSIYVRWWPSGEEKKSK